MMISLLKFQEKIQNFGHGHIFGVSVIQMGARGANDGKTPLTISCAEPVRRWGWEAQRPLQQPRSSAHEVP